MEERKGRECFGHTSFIPSAFSPAFSSCSLTTSFMCCHWGSPSPISWTLTSPSGLLPVLYLVILILTWSSAAWSGVTRQKRDKQHSWPQNPSAGSQDGGGKSQKCVIQKHYICAASYLQLLDFNHLNSDLMKIKSPTLGSMVAEDRPPTDQRNSDHTNSLWILHQTPCVCLFWDGRCKQLPHMWMKREDEHRPHGDGRARCVVTWLLRGQAGAAPGRVAASLDPWRLLLRILNVLLLQMIEQLIQCRLQCLCCMGAIKLPFQTLGLQLLLSLQHREKPVTSEETFRLFYCV